MKLTNAELLDLVHRYKDESGIPIGTDLVLGFAVFARWLLQQNLQQCNVMRGGTPEPLAFLFQKLKEVDAAPPTGSVFVSDCRNAQRKKITDAIQLIREIMLDANGA